MKVLASPEFQPKEIKTLADDKQQTQWEYYREWSRRFPFEPQRLACCKKHSDYAEDES